MSCKLVNRIAPSRGWKKTGVNIYMSSDGAVEADIIHSWSGGLRHSVLTFKWSATGLVVKAYVYDPSQGVDCWSAELGPYSTDLVTIPSLPTSTPDVVWVIFVLSSIGQAA